MPTGDHVKLVKRGMDALRKWREGHPGEKLDLENADLRGIEFVGKADRSWRSHLSWLSNLSSKDTPYEIDLSEVNLKRANLSGANLVNLNLDEADLEAVNLKGARINLCSLRGSNLRQAQITDAVIQDSILIDADLSEAEVLNANLSGTDLSRASLRSGKLYGVNLEKARLVDATLSEATLNVVDFSGCDVTRADFSKSTGMSNNYVDVDLSVARGLETMVHQGPSAIDVRTLYLSKGMIPVVFLRGCGVPEVLIEYLPSLTGQAIQFYSCFISFTENDEFFSERLYNDMQARGVRCWRWKEDAKWGRTLMREVDEAVRLYDKLVVICSEQSLKAPAVLREIERALRKEDEQYRQGKEGEVLFPVRIDDFIFHGWEHHLKSDVLAKNVGDFRNWQEPELYRKALERLIRDLQAQVPPNSAAPADQKAPLSGR